MNTGFPNDEENILDKSVKIGEIIMQFISSFPYFIVVCNPWNEHT